MKLLSAALVAALGCILLTAPSSGADFTTLYSFTGGASDGTGPEAGVTLSGSTLYGTTSAVRINGTLSGGNLYKINTDGTGFQALRELALSDLTNPVVVSGSTIYGLSGPGANGFGSIYSIGTDGSGYQDIYSFAGPGNQTGSGPNSLTLSGSTLFGTTGTGGITSGVVFRLNTDGSGYETLPGFTDSFDSGRLIGALVHDTTVYGSTAQGYNGGVTPPAVIFKMNSDGTDYQILHSFNDITGSTPSDGAMNLTLIGSTLYGFKSIGLSALGDQGGALFKMNVDGSGYQVLHDFGSLPGDGILANIGSLVANGSTLYGTTFDGGIHDGSGTIFKINADGSGYQVLYSFTGGAGGVGPIGAIALASSTLYGVTEEGGAHFQGTIYAFTVPEPSCAVLVALSGIAVALAACGAKSLRSARRDGV